MATDIDRFSGSIKKQQQKINISGSLPSEHPRANPLSHEGSARTEKRLLFEWHLKKLPCTECCTPSPYHLVDPFSRSSNRWLCLWLQASVIALACDINGSSPWEFSNTSNHIPHLHTFIKRWQYKHAEKILCLLEVICVWLISPSELQR